MSFLSSLLSLFKPEPGSRVDAVEAKRLLGLPASDRPRLIDVRTTGEWKQGRIQGAVHMDVSSADFERKAHALPREGRYLLYCQSGARSGIARSRMKSMGFAEVSHLAGGMSAWRAARLPVAR